MSTSGESDHGMAFVSAPPGEAERIAREIVAQKLAAGAQVLSVMTSIYWWKGALQTEPERLILLKTRRPRVAQIDALLRRIHPYEVPELTFVPFTEAAGPYREWMDGVLGG